MFKMASYRKRYLWSNQKKPKEMLLKRHIIRRFNYLRELWQEINLICFRKINKSGTFETDKTKRWRRIEDWEEKKATDIRCIIERRAWSAMVSTLFNYSSRLFSWKIFESTAVGVQKSHEWFFVELSVPRKWHLGREPERGLKMTLKFCSPFIDGKDVHGLLGIKTVSDFTPSGSSK